MKFYKELEQKLGTKQPIKDKKPGFQRGFIFLMSFNANPISVKQPI